MRASRTPVAGGRTSPRTAAGPADRHRGSAGRRPAVSRRCRAGRGRRGPSAALASTTAACGPSTSITAHGAVAELLVEPAYDGRARAACSWVAQAVESVRTTSRPSAKDSGVQCGADLGARRARPSGRTRRATRGRSPSRGRRRAGSSVVSSSLRVAVVGVRARDRGRRRAGPVGAGGVRRLRASAGRPRRRAAPRSRGPGRARRRGAPARAARLGPPARRGRLGPGGSLRRSRRHLPVGHDEARARPAPRARRRPPPR